MSHILLKDAKQRNREEPVQTSITVTDGAERCTNTSLALKSKDMVWAENGNCHVIYTHPHKSQNWEVCICECKRQWAGRHMCQHSSKHLSWEEAFSSLQYLSLDTPVESCYLSCYSAKYQNLRIHHWIYLTRNFLCSFQRHSENSVPPNHVKDHLTEMMCHLWQILGTVWMQAKKHLAV